MISLQQIQNATLADLQDNPALFSSYLALRGLPPNKGEALLSLYAKNPKEMDNDKGYMQSRLYEGYLKQAERSLEQYGNWNNPKDTGKYNSNAAANTAREKGLASLNEASVNLEKLGIDPKSVPQMQQYATQFGSSAGGGLTSQQTSGMTYESGKGWTDKPTATIPPTQSTLTSGTPTSPAPSNLTLQSVLDQPNVKSDPKLTAWVNGNASLIPKLASLGYSATDIANEAYSWTRANHSAFSGDMTNTQRSANKPFGAETGSQSGANTPTGTTPQGDQTNPSQGQDGPANDTSTPAPEGQMDSKGQRQKLIDLGIDQSQVGMLSDEQVGSLFSMHLVQQANADKNKNIVPPTNSPQDMEGFLRDAHTVIDPYYAEQLKIGSTEILNAVADLSGDLAYKSQLQADKSLKEQQEMADGLAEQGLAYSGIRKKAETERMNNEQGLVRSVASQYQNAMRDSALQYEKTYGSDALRALNIKDLNYAGANIAAPQALGNMMGTNPKQQETDALVKRSSLAADALVQKGTMTGAITPFPVTPSI